VFSGFAMVQTLLLVMRKVMKLENYITVKHVEYMNIVIIVTGSIVGRGLHHRAVHQLVQRRGVRELRLHQPRTGPTGGPIGA
jgi:hypothetical protein